MKNSLSLFILGAALLTSTAQATSPEALLIEGILCVAGRENYEQIQEQIGRVGGATTRPYLNSLATKMNGTENGIRSYAETTSKLVVLLSVDGSEESLCRNGGQRTDILITLKK